jgi:large subunit ribosomal protein L24
MISSGKPRKQRKFRFAAPLHARQHFLHAHLAKEARQKLGIKVRAVQISKGDTVKVMSGKKKGTTGKVTSVSLRKNAIYLDSYVKKNAKGKEYGVPINVSNVYITDLNLVDKARAAKLKQQPAKAQVQAAPAQEQAQKK